MIFGKKVNKYYKKYALFYILGIVFLLVVDYAQLEIPEILSDIIEGIEDGVLTKELLGKSVISIIILVLIVYTGRFLWRLFIFGGSRNIDFDLRNEMFSHCEKLSADFYSENKTGGLMAYFTNDLEAVRMSLGPGVILAVDVLFLGTLAIYKMIMLDWKLTLLSTLPIFMITLIGIFLGKRIEFRFNT